MNFEENGDTCMSPLRVLREKKAHCIEGAMLAALCLKLAGREPLLLDLTSVDRDHDHVVALYKEAGFFGAISKTNHVTLRYREPVYRTLRELALSYFHEYYLEDGAKTLRSYSVPVHLERFSSLQWETNSENLWEIPMALADARHVPLVSRSQIARLRKADGIERSCLALEEWVGSSRMFPD